MKPEIERAMREVLEAWETPDSPEALACAMYQMARIYKAAVIEQAKEQTRRELRKHSRHNESSGGTAATDARNH
jgi:hypothetical protein